MPTPDRLIEIATRHQVILEGHKNAIVREFVDFLRSLEKDVKTQIDAIEDPTALKGRRLNQLLKAVRETLNKGYRDHYGGFRQHMVDLADYEAEFTGKALEQIVDYRFALPTPGQLATAAFAKPLDVKGVDGGALLKTFYDEWTRKTRRRTEGAIRLGAAKGETNAEIARKIQEGFVDTSRREAVIITRTAVQHVAQQAKQATYAANADIIKGEEYVATLDNRTSAPCRGLDGQEFKMGEGPIPPIHLNCRSVRLPVMDDGLDFLDDIGTRATRGQDGKVRQVAAGQDYYAWLKKQAPEFQDEILGSTRGKLFRDGGLSVERFRKLQLDKRFRERSLDDMRKLEPLAFGKAFGDTKPRFEYENFVAPKNTAEAEVFVSGAGIAVKADMKGIAVKNIPEALQAMQEIHERFGLKPLAAVGPSTRFGLQRVGRANAAIFPSARHKETGARGVFHMPTHFGSVKRYDDQKALAEKYPDHYLGRRARTLVARSNPLPRDVLERLGKMPSKDYSWTLTTPLGHGKAQQNVVYHEYGHVVHMIDDRMGPEINAFLKKARPRLDGWQYLLSEYAGQDDHEFVAESFAAYMSGAKQHYRINPDLLAIFKRFDKRK